MSQQAEDYMDDERYDTNAARCDGRMSDRGRCSAGCRLILAADSEQASALLRLGGGIGQGSRWSPTPRLNQSF